eukprot:354140-Chlamydomonas_euryale.AAC.7
MGLVARAAWAACAMPIPAPRAHSQAAWPDCKQLLAKESHANSLFITWTSRRCRLLQATCIGEQHRGCNVATLRIHPAYLSWAKLRNPVGTSPTLAIPPSCHLPTA